MNHKLIINGNKRAVIAFLIIAAVTFTDSFQLSANWEAVNSPTGGLIAQLLYHNNKLIAATPGAGIFMSSDEGVNWNQITKGFGWLRITTAIAVDENYIYASTVNDEVFRTADEGKNWESIQNGLEDLIKNQYSINKIKKIRSNLYVCTNNGVYVLPDNETNWIQKSYGLSGLAINTYDIEEYNNSLYLGTQAGTFRSIDNGTIWQNTTLPDYATYYKLFFMNNKIYACYFDSQGGKGIYYDIFESSDGINWSPDPMIIFRNCNILEFVESGGKSLISTEIVNGTNLLSQVQITTDGGSNWAEIYNHTDKFFQNYHYLFSGLSISQNNNFVGTRYNGILKNSFPLSQWNFSNSGLFNIQITSIVSKGANLFAGTLENGIYLSPDKGVTWSLLPSSPKTNESMFGKINNLKIDGANIFASSSVGLYLSSDDGLTWKDMGLFDNVIDIIIDNGIIYAVGKSSSWQFRISTDFGNSWSSRKISDLSDINIYSLLKDGSNFIIGTSYGIMKTTDNGTSWINVAPQLKDIKSVRSLVRSKNNILGSSWDGVYLSTDNGTNWITSDNGLKNKVIHSLYATGNYVFCASDSGAYITLDRGSSWNEIDSGLKNYEIYGYGKEGTLLYAYLLGDAIQKSEIREFFPIILNNIPNSILCGDMEFSISFSVKNYISFGSENIFSAELSDLDGDFSNQHIVIGTAKTSTSGVINVKIPKGLPFGTKYRIRIVSSEPQLIGSDETQDLTILNKSIPVITGDNKVCAGVNVIYSVTQNPGYTYKWLATNGNIVGSDNNVQVNVIWNSTGTGNLKVRQENVLQCSDSSNIDITIHPVPETPLITRKDSILESSSDTGNQWFLNGNILSGETSKSIQPKSYGSYTVQVVNEFGCLSNMSSPFNFENDNNIVKLRVDNISGDAGDIINLNIRLIKSKDFSKYKIQSISTVLVIDASVLYPMDVASTLSENKRFIPLAFDTNYITDNIVKVIRLRAMLGDKVQSPLTLENIRITGDNVEIQSVSGTFTLTGLCFQGGPRLITSSGESGIVSIKPNPAQNEFQIDFQNNEDGITTLYLLNTLGEQEKVFINEEVPPGFHTMNFSLKDISAGGYYLVLQTMNDRVVKELIITK